MKPLLPILLLLDLLAGAARAEESPARIEKLLIEAEIRTDDTLRVRETYTFERGEASLPVLSPPSILSIAVVKASSADRSSDKAWLCGMRALAGSDLLRARPACFISRLAAPTWRAAAVRALGFAPALVMASVTDFFPAAAVMSPASLSARLPSLS